MSQPRKWIRRFGLILALGSAALLSGAGYFAWKPAPLPEAEVAIARRAFVSASLARGIRPDDLAQADSLSRVMESIYARESSRLVRYRRPLDLVAAADGLRAASCLAESVAAADQADLRAGNRFRQEALEQRLHLISGQVAAMPGAKRLRRAFQHAQMALGGARDLGNQGELAAQTAQLDSASVAVDRAEMLFDRRLARFDDPKLRDRWQAWVEETVEATRSGGTAIVVDKLNRNCLVVRGRKVVARFHGELGRNGLSDKLYAGDGATPEGKYKVTHKNTGSRYFLALLLDYPQSQDLARHDLAAREGRIPAGAGPGGLIEIHGNGGRGNDWTEGCVALKDEDMELLFNLVEVGTPVTIVGTARLRGE